MIRKLLEKSEILKHIVVLLQGTVIAQVIVILSQLFLRRIFSVSDFGIMALYASAVGILSMLATGRYEMAIVLPKEDKNARTIFRISMTISLIFNAFLLLILVFSADAILDLIVRHELVDPAKVTNMSMLSALIYLIPVGVFTLCLFNAYNYLFTRQKAYKQLSKSRIAQATSTNGISALLGLASVGFIGLFFGYVLGLLTSVIFLSMSKLRLLKGDRGNTRENLKNYRDFPYKSVPSGIINMLALQLPTFFIFSFYGAEVLGIFDIITRVLNTPVTMVGPFVSQVFYQKVSADLNEGNPISGYIKKFASRLFLFMLIPMSIIFFFGEPIFAFVFGEEYRISGKISSYFALYFLVRFVYYSLSTFFSAVRRIGVEFRQNVIFLISQVAALVIGDYYFDSFEITFMLLALSGFLCYSLFIFTLFRTAKQVDS